MDTNFAVVDADDATNHLGDDNHVTEVSLDNSRLLIWWCLLLCLSELLDETHRLALQTTLEPATGTSMYQLHEMISDLWGCFQNWQEVGIPQRTEQVLH